VSIPPEAPFNARSRSISPSGTLNISVDSIAHFTPTGADSVRGRINLSSLSYNRDPADTVRILKEKLTEIENEKARI
jgi:chromosome segregation ATPase